MKMMKQAATAAAVTRSFAATLASATSLVHHGFSRLDPIAARKCVSIVGFALASLLTLPTTAGAVVFSGSQQIQAVTASYFFDVKDLSGRPLEESDFTNYVVTLNYNNNYYYLTPTNSYLELGRTYPYGDNLLLALGSNFGVIKRDENVYLSFTSSRTDVQINQGFFSADSNNGYYASASPVTAVPEPATWLMLIVGFGMIGGAIRYRRRPPGIALADALPAKAETKALSGFFHPGLSLRKGR